MLTKSIHAKLVKLADAHQKADEYKSGFYEWNDGASSIGCTIHDAKKLELIPENVSGGSHKAWGELSGVGEEVANLQDCIFEGLRGKARREFTPKLLRAITPGRTARDFSLVWPKFSYWMLTVELMSLVKDDAKTTKAISDVAALYQKWIEGCKPEIQSWEAAREAAGAAAGLRFWNRAAKKLIALLSEAK